MIDYDAWASKFVGKCWHELTIEKIEKIDGQVSPVQICDKCHKKFLFSEGYFIPTTSDSDYFELVIYVRSHKEISNFLNFLWTKWDDSKAITSFDMFLLDILFDRERGTKAIYEYFSKEEV